MSRDVKIGFSWLSKTFNYIFKGAPIKMVRNVNMIRIVNISSWLKNIIIIIISSWALSSKCLEGEHLIIPLFVSIMENDFKTKNCSAVRRDSKI